MNTTTTTTTLPAALIDPGSNDRTVFDPDALNELASSIDQHGLAQPITVRPVADRFEIVAGERRFRAMGVLGWDEIPVIVRELDDETASAIMLVENVQRADLNPVDEAHAYQSRMDRYDMTAAEVAAMAGVTTARVATRLPVLRLIDDAQDLVRIGQLSLNHAKVMADLEPNRQILALRALREKNLAYFEFRDLCARLADEQAADPLFDVENVMAFEEYVADAQAGRAAKARGARQLIAAMADALDAADVHDGLVAEARQFLTRKAT